MEDSRGSALYFCKNTGYDADDNEEKVDAGAPDNFGPSEDRILTVLLTLPRGGRQQSVRSETSGGESAPSSDQRSSAVSDQQDILQPMAIPGRAERTNLRQVIFFGVYRALPRH